MVIADKTPLKLGPIPTKNKLAPRSNTQIKLAIFRNGGRVQKCGLGDIISKGIAYIFNGQDGTFNGAFRKARNEGQEYFRWNGNLYNTNLKPTSFQPKESSLDITHKFTSRNFDEFISVMYPIFEDSLKRKGLPTTQIQNLIRQAAYESTYGTDPRGSQGYNLGGIKWFNDPNSNTYKYKHTTNPKDGLEYVDFDSLQDYADFKVDLLHNTYKALDARDTNDFVKRLHGNNPYKKSYSANPNGYMKTLNGMLSLDKAYNNYVAKRK